MSSSPLLSSPKTSLSSSAKVTYNRSKAFCIFDAGLTVSERPCMKKEDLEAATTEYYTKLVNTYNLDIMCDQRLICKVPKDHEKVIIKELARKFIVGNICKI